MIASENSSQFTPPGRIAIAVTNLETVGCAATRELPGLRAPHPATAAITATRATATAAMRAMALIVPPLGHRTGQSGQSSLARIARLHHLNGGTRPEPSKARSLTLGGIAVVQELDPGDPQLMGPYRLVGQLGSGGMGRVFLGLSAGGRPVAVKIIHADLAADPEFRVRFRREVAAARQVSGLFTALVVDADVDGPVPWLATAYVPGPSLAEAVADHGPMSARPVLALAAGLAESLSAIHAAGVVHCDLKPSNVLLSQDGPRVIDFGISRAAAEAAATRGGLIIGSPGYMSPEQALGRPGGPPCDVFSLGAVLAFAATGRAPFGGGSPPEVGYRVVYGRPDLDGLPGQLRPLVERCLAKDPGRRPTAAAVLAEVGALQPANGWLPDAVANAFRRPATADSRESPSPREPTRPREPTHLQKPTRPREPTHLQKPTRLRERPRRPRRPLAAAWVGGAILAATAAGGMALSGGTGNAPATQDQPRTPAAGSSASPGTHASRSLPPRTSSEPSVVSAANALPATHRSRAARASTSARPSKSPSASPTTSPSSSPSSSASPSASPTTSPSASPTGSASVSPSGPPQSPPHP
jgi:serine/threonine protein kinase